MNERKAESVIPALRNVIVIDCETGGLNPITDAILSLALVTGDLRRSLEVKIQQHGAVSPEALAVNRIDLDQHNREAVSMVEACNAVSAFVAEVEAEANGERLYLAGHNVAFDLGFVLRLYDFGGLLGNCKCPRLFGPHRMIDTHSILWALSASCGMIIPTDSSGAFEFYGIRIPEEQRHTAIGDATATAQLLGRLLRGLERGRMLAK